MSLLGHHLLGLSSLVFYSLLLRSCAFLSRSVLFLLLFLCGHLDNLDEAGSGDAVIVLSVKGSLQSGQVFVGDVEATVVADPVGERVDAHVAHVLSVHVVENTLSVELQLVAFLVDFCISLDNQTEDGGKLLEPGALVKVSLFDREEGGGVGSARRSLCFEGCNPFVEFDSAIFISVNQLH